MADYMTPSEVSEMTNGALTLSNLSQLRYRGDGPRFLKPTPRVVLYERAEVERWLASSVYERTDKPVPLEEVA
ncbi:hypothetical protein M3D15_04005 [Pseudoclavibacter alba]|uniref:Helix-turn-helix domain-containing protein n=1 Tax=Pseudoclavibacter albus TaxID=272241 RepID=A0ABT2HW03_9MICO|nr:hypothetical protein [Pseudoclavibacter alba]MCT2042499.1 hypothetical protein [Pseudoclavibacter alba]